MFSGNFLVGDISFWQPFMGETDIQEFLGSLICYLFWCVCYLWKVSRFWMLLNLDGHAGSRGAKVIPRV